jgi:hypothetical protein
MLELLKRSKQVIDADDLQNYPWKLVNSFKISILTIIRIFKKAVNVVFNSET